MVRYSSSWGTRTPYSLPVSRRTDTRPKAVSGLFPRGFRLGQSKITASESHHVFLTNGEGGKIGEKILKQSGERLVEIAAWLMAMSRAAGPDQIHITIEFHTVPGRNADRVHVINPKRMERFRDHFALADSPFFNAK